MNANKVTTLKRPFQTRPENVAAQERIREYVVIKWQEAKDSDAEVPIAWLEMEAATGVSMKAQPGRGEVRGRELARRVMRKLGIVYSALSGNGIVLLGVGNATLIVHEQNQKAVRQLVRAGKTATIAMERVGDKLSAHERDRLMRTNATMQTLVMQAQMSAKLLNK